MSREKGKGIVQGSRFQYGNTAVTKMERESTKKIIPLPESALPSLSEDAEMAIRGLVGCWWGRMSLHELVEVVAVLESLGYAVPDLRGALSNSSRICRIMPTSKR